MTATFTGAGLATSVRVVVTRPSALPAVRRALESSIDAFDHAASRFRPDSELTRANDAAGTPVTIGPVLRDSLRSALRMAAATRGLVDPTVGASVVAAGYDRTFADLGATNGRLTSGVRPAGVPTWRDVTFVDAPDVTTLTVPLGCRLDLGAVGKAWLADTVAAASSGVAGGVLIDLGGDIAVSGEPPPGGWVIGLPPGTDGQTAVAIRSGGVATSAQDVRRWQMADGPAHHIIDPRHGQPARSPWRSATVHAATATEANAASTAAIILGHDAPAWLDSLGLCARLVALDGSDTVCVGAWPSQPRRAV